MTNKLIKQQKLLKTSSCHLKAWDPNISDKEVTATTCPYCGVGCGVLAKVDEHGEVIVSGDPEHPANYGRLCSKGSALPETVYHKDRMLYPKVQGQQVSWELALYAIADTFNSIIEEYGPDAIAFYVSGQLLTEDYYVANKLMKGFIGSANIDTNSRLCMSSAVAAYKRSFGEDVVPCQYNDLDKADLIVITGSNMAWCHPVIFQRIVKAKKTNPSLQVVVIDPRETQTTSIADLHLSLKPGTDGLLFNGLLVWLTQHNKINDLFLENTQGAAAAIATAESHYTNIENLALQCGLSVAALKQFFHLFADNEKTVSVFSQGINQSSSGTDKANSIINCHLITGRIGRPGMGPFSITGQPNAMGGREVGGLANQLAAHMDINDSSDRERVRRFWKAPLIADKEGLKAIDLFNAINSGKVKAVWIMGTNPAVSMPDADKVKQALKKCEVVIVSDCMENTDTTALANITLPAVTWGERDGTVTNSERCISRQRAFLQGPGLARPDWWIISQVAQCMGFTEHFNYDYPADIFKEHSQLSCFENDGQRIFNLSGFAKINFQQYDQLKPSYWPYLENQINNDNAVFKNLKFPTTNNKARLIAINPKLPIEELTPQFPLRLNSGRVRDHWHTMSRTGMSPRLSSHTFEPYAEIHPQDAEQYQIRNRDLVQIKSSLKTQIVVRAVISNKQQIGSVFVPIHWNNQFSSQARVSSLYNAFFDPISGQPESKHGAVAIEQCKVSWYGFMISRHDPQLNYASYWTKSRGKGLWRYELAGWDKPEDWSIYARKLFNNKLSNENWIEFYDKSEQHYRLVRMQADRIESCLFIYSDNVLPSRDWLISLFHKESINIEERNNLLKAQPPETQKDSGKIICSCFNVGEKTIKESIKQLQLKTVDQLGQQLKAGTNCGSCKPELAEFF